MKKFLFACLLILAALYLVLSQQGAIQPAIDNYRSGKTGALMRGN